MKRFYLSGQRTFSNRGNEAIVRATVALLARQFGEVEVLVPSTDIVSDSAQWPEAGASGVRFVAAYLPAQGRYWVLLQSLPLPVLKRAGWPFRMPSWLKRQLASVDAVLAVGGDNYSLDYRIPSPVMALDRFAMDMGKPVILWGGSVGPFEREPAFVGSITRHLSRMHYVAARESLSHRYLTEQLGLRNVIRMVDPAFMLVPEAVDLKAFWPTGGSNVLGLNVSQLMERYRRPGQDLRAEVATFIRHAVNVRGMGVLLVPHNDPWHDKRRAGDAAYMAPLLAGLADLGRAVTMMPQSMNAAQAKYVISHLRLFIGARTHAIIAALSSGVPAVSIAYSVKARGINRDLFGSEDMVLQIPDVTATSLGASLAWLLRKERALRTLLARRMAEWQHAARAAAGRLSEVFVN